jgi:hypothetical protein
MHKTLAIGALAFSGLALLGSIGCTPGSATQVLADTSYDVAMAERFGRLDIVSDQVAPPKRQAFIDAHADWGGDIRIVDLEYGGMRLSDERHAEVLLTVAWQRLDEASLRTTHLSQAWVHAQDRWFIEDEKEVSGDHGLLDEADPKVDGDKDGKKASARGPRGESTRGGHRSQPPEERGLDDPAPLGSFD